MQISDENFKQFLAQHNQLVGSLAENTKQTALLTQSQNNLTVEFKRMNTRLFGEKDDGIFYKLTERVNQLETRWKVADGMVLVICGLFTFVSQKLGWFTAAAATLRGPAGH